MSHLALVVVLAAFFVSVPAALADSQASPTTPYWQDPYPVGTPYCSMNVDLSTPQGAALYNAWISSTLWNHVPYYQPPQLQPSAVAGLNSTSTTPAATFCVP